MSACSAAGTTGRSARAGPTSRRTPNETTIPVHAARREKLTARMAGLSLRNGASHPESDARGRRARKLSDGRPKEVAAVSNVERDSRKEIRHGDHTSVGA